MTELFPCVMHCNICYFKKKSM